MNVHRLCGPFGHNRDPTDCTRGSNDAGPDLDRAGRRIDRPRAEAVGAPQHRRRHGIPAREDFFPKLCLLQIAAGEQILCVDAMRCRLDPLLPPFTADATRKIVHAARQDLEALYFPTRRVMTPIFDTQVAAGCVGLKPQIGYAELASTLLGVRLTKEQTRTDWSRRPLSPRTARLRGRRRALPRRHRRAARRAAARARPRGLGRRGLRGARGRAPLRAAAGRVLGAAARPRAARPGAARARAGRSRCGASDWPRDRDLPRSWILADAAIFDVAFANPASAAALYEVRGIPPSFNRQFAESLVEALQQQARAAVVDSAPRQDARPTDAQKALLDRLIGVVDARAAELGLSAEILAPRGELKALALRQSRRSRARRLAARRNRGIIVVESRLGTPHRALEAREHRFDVRVRVDDPQAARFRGSG